MQLVHDRERSEEETMSECTRDGCDNKAQFGLWIGGEFSVVYRSHATSSHEKGELHPFVCEECRPLFAEMFQLGEFRQVESAQVD